MAIEIFTWSPRVNPTQTVNFRTRKAQFGDGYAQVSGDGLNTRSQEWELNFVGTEDYIRPIKQFLDRHGGTKSFQWTPPLEDIGIFRCEQYKPVPMGGGNYSLSATFIQGFKP
ncbi:phage tail protein [Klebsiella michiganensis]|jgi:phage-related protein|nr:MULTISPECIES: phage tail protein [Bacteria]AUV95424.1 phage tail protein [Klebsiella oxytoca]ELS5458853.1 phage tail protein [Raoultella ornithinolytica]EME8857461.1 phage tail protein [Klebsiella aerogenes]MBS6112414.1 phage tail protein [Citrobacter freundii]DAM09608.1 MAG TPA: minor tail protein [Caudoviricetes sp.]